MIKDISGKRVVEKIEIALANKQYEGRLPTLAILRVGHKTSDSAYETSLTKVMKRLNIKVLTTHLANDISQQKFDFEFDQLNNDEEIDGILLFNPVPSHLSLEHVVAQIDPSKDVDCIGAINTLKIYLDNEKGFLPCTAEAVLKILAYQEIELKGKDVVIIGFGFVIGRPLSLLLVEAGCTVTVCHIDTVNLAEKCRRAEIIVSATGVPSLVNEEYVKEGAVVIDVGINVDKRGHLCGDVDYESVYDKVKSITPVPGGVGTVTTYTLAEHVVQSFENK
ncbi:bifunctional 5,10-methylenetetrahydrofolate dehydrogenase/5,10-methenyltetrahydrofolate cyclohydrolase [Vagococcus sp.]|uniref:bifunctional 5,10-methylenetetrahydrofolate dehydrogenase/5,10-methenyltetrahydrofolate cyclohydrolase n=1 Tax=Vagococcus sp. TaxID=1933889 RepID=UPI003F9BBCBE